jgi:acyl-CoA thioester hydrolase
MQEFIWPIRVYLEDTDSQGVVYNASYFRFMERARTEWLRDRGVEHDDARERHGVLFVLTAIEARFRAPARLGDLLHVSATMIEARGARMVFEQSTCRAADARELLCNGRAEVACMDAVQRRPRRWPEGLLRELVK